MFENCFRLMIFGVHDSDAVTVKLPDKVREIGAEAFIDCASLHAIKMPVSLSNIDYAAFKHCESLAFVEMPDSVTRVADAVFSHCENFTGIRLPHSAAKIDDGILKGCTSLARITIKNRQQRLQKLQRVVKNNSLLIWSDFSRVADAVFSHCENFTGIRLSHSAAKIDDGTFKGCTSLARITIKNRQQRLQKLQRVVKNNSLLIWSDFYD